MSATLCDQSSDEDCSLKSEDLQLTDTESSSDSESSVYLADWTLSENEERDLLSDNEFQSGEIVKADTRQKISQLSNTFHRCSLTEAHESIEDAVSELLSDSWDLNSRVQIVCKLQAFLQFPKPREGFLSTLSTFPLKPVRGVRVEIRKAPYPEHIDKRCPQTTPHTLSPFHNTGAQSRRASHGFRASQQCRKRHRKLDRLPLIPRPLSSEPSMHYPPSISGSDNAEVSLPSPDGAETEEIKMLRILQIS